MTNYSYKFMMFQDKLKVQKSIDIVVYFPKNINSICYLKDYK